MDVRAAFTAAWGRGVPPIGLALYARWWQIESWLRSLVYVELRAKFGPRWADQIPRSAKARQRGEEDFHYMRTPDSHTQLAYTDVRVMAEIVANNWSLFEHSLLRNRAVWEGRIEEVLTIRNRIGHCRRPHDDDLRRLEQFLRDLEPGALLAAQAYHSRYAPTASSRDPVFKAWTGHEHDDAARLVDHAARRYDIFFGLEASCRPWAGPMDLNSNITGRPGLFWHATWMLRGTDSFNLDQFWRRASAAQSAIVFVTAITPRMLDISFSALESATTIADAIGTAFDSLIETRLRGGGNFDSYEQWIASVSNLDQRIQVNSPWTDLPPTSFPISIFGA